MTWLGRWGVVTGSLLLSLLCLPLPLHAIAFEGVVTHVTDGDSIWVRPLSGGAAHEVRLQDIDAPEICQAFGEKSRRALAAHLLQRRVTVTGRARDSYQRVLARVSVGGEDVGGWMVRRGYAWSHRYRRAKASPYQDEESHARTRRLGLWQDGTALEPRRFRRQHGRCG